VNSFMKSCVFVCFVFYCFLHRQLCYLQIQKVYFFLSNLSQLVTFFLHCIGWTFSALLNMSDREKYPCLVPNLRGKYFALYYQVGWHLLGFVNAV
jgi:hypothetical protein